MSRIIIALLLILIPAVMQAQDLYQLPANEYSAGIGLAFAENSTTISCAFEYGILPALEGSLGAGLEFAQESDPEISVPPAPIFAVKISSTKPLGRTGLRYLTATSFTVEFAKIIHEYTDEEVKVRGMYLSVGLGITKPINYEGYSGVEGEMHWPLLFPLPRFDLVGQASQNSRNSAGVPLAVIRYDLPILAEFAHPCRFSEID